MYSFMQPPDPPEIGHCLTCNRIIHVGDKRGDNCIDCDEPETAQCLCGKRGEINYDDGTERCYYCYSGPDCCP
ncbi:hypothetical protein [Pseudomonas poae]|uniref:hypothetical protein n=1 Tax=Pseudomonas poae TaxID=200451 RepID=UPI0030D32347